MLLKRSHRPGVCKTQILTLQAGVGAGSLPFSASQGVPSCPARTAREQQAAGTPLPLPGHTGSSSSVPCPPSWSGRLQLPRLPARCSRSPEDSSEVEGSFAGVQPGSTAGVAALLGQGRGGTAVSGVDGFLSSKTPLGRLGLWEVSHLWLVINT